MKFVSTTGEDIHIALTNGRTAFIPVGEAVELDKAFHKEAIARGAAPEGMEADEPEAVAGQFNREQVITDAMNAMLDGGAEDDFTGDGRPNLRKLTARVGFTVAREEADAIWAKVSKPNDE